MRRVFRFIGALLLVAAIASSGGVLSAPKTMINLVTAGDQNMVDLFQDEIGPAFMKANPGIEVRVVGTGPGDAGSQKIIEKLRAQKNAGKAVWDMDVAIIHEIGAAWALTDDLLAKYAPSANTYRYVTSNSANTPSGQM